MNLSKSFHIDTNAASDEIASSRDLSFAVYVERDDESADLISIFPATDRLLERPCGHEDGECTYSDESYAFHMAHECAASLEYDQSERAVVVVSQSSDTFPDVFDLEPRILTLKDVGGPVTISPEVFDRFLDVIASVTTPDQ